MKPESRNGLKKTKIGWIPKDWDVSQVENLFSVQLGKMLNQQARKGDKQYSYLGNANVQWGRVDVSTLQTMSFSDKEREKFSLRLGDLLVCEGGEVGRTAIWRNELTPCFFQKAIHRLRPLKGLILPEYMMFFMHFIAGQKILGELTSQSSIAHLTREKLLKLPVIVPPLIEQRGISSILSVWDTAIEQTANLILAKTKLKRGLMQQLLTGKRRFEVFVIEDGKNLTKYGAVPKDWLYIHIREVAKEVTEKNSNNRKLTVLSCTKHQGLVDSLSYFGKQIFSKNLSTYKVVKRGSFAYATNHIEEGSIGYQNLYDEALISPMYTVFETNNQVDDAFFFRLLKTELYRHIFETNTSGSIDRRGALRWEDFASIKIALPSLEEQQRIATMLNACDEELGLLRQKLNALKKQKRGLMQKLLTGQIRVKVNEQSKQEGVRV